MLYTAVFSAVAVTAQQDLFELNCATDSICIVHAIELSQGTELGDAAEEQVAIILRRGNTTSGTGGTAPTPQPVETGSSAFGGTVEVNNTTKATAGTPVTLYAGYWNIRSSWLWLPTPEMRPILAPSTRFCVELATTPADSITVSGVLTLEELGG